MSKEIEFISTKRGGRALLSDGHRKKTYTNSDSTYWLCHNINYGCTGSVTLNVKNGVVKIKTHKETCKQDLANNKILKELDNLKEKCSHNFDSIQTQYDNMVFSLEEAGLDFVREMPKFQNIKTGLLRSNSSIEAVVPDKFKKFLLAEYSDDDKKILLFCNQRAASIKECYYHLNRCLFRKAKSLKLTTRVKKRHVARCAGLARLPKAYFRKGYEYVMSKSPSGVEITKFNKHFNHQWMAKTDFEKICCCSSSKIRTTNNIEGWHSRLNRYIGQIDEEINDAISQLNENEISVGHCIEIISPFYSNRL
ncbi:hypothetical protein ABMA28_000382 [Loxostege sticticalis]|uniref:FLYWCH-type domain-containing protein n=1 Tax=Loxostege sticticalis TaxID=481309 RepID=A0ABD0TSH1_LOXSC